MTHKDRSMIDSSARGQSSHGPENTAGDDPLEVAPSDLRAALEAHKDGSGKFTRRMAINIGDFFGLLPMTLVWRMEKTGVLKRGSYEWFKSNGGITNDHIEEARAARLADAHKSRKDES